LPEIHGCHACRVLGGDRLGHGVEEHGKNVLREQTGEELLGGLLVNVVDVGVPNFLASSSASAVSAASMSMPAERGRLGDALLLFGGGLDGAGNLAGSQDR